MNRRSFLRTAAAGGIGCLAGCTARAAPDDPPIPRTARKLVSNGRSVPLFAFYYTWYGTPYGPAKMWTHWGKPAAGPAAPKGTDPSRVTAKPHIRDIASMAYPLIGPYDSRNREVVRWHIRLAKAAGLDGFLVDWWGPGGWQKPPGQTYKAFVDAVLPIAEEENFKVALCDELPQFYANFDHVVDWTAQYLDRFRKSPAYMHINGRPVYYVYQVWQGKMKPDDCRRLIDAVEKRVGPVCWMIDKMRCRLATGLPRNRELFFPDEWLAMPEIDTLAGYATFCNVRMHERDDLRVLYKRLVDQGHAAGRKVLLPVHPGHDNSKYNPKPYAMPRENGWTFRGFLDAAIEADADFIAVTSFNEWPETTVVEPSLSWLDPYQYLKIIAEYTGTPWQTPPLPPVAALDPLIRDRP